MRLTCGMACFAFLAITAYMVASVIYSTQCMAISKQSNVVSMPLLEPVAASSSGAAAAVGYATYVVHHEFPAGLLQVTRQLVEDSLQDNHSMLDALDGQCVYIQRALSVRHAFGKGGAGGIRIR